MEQKSQAPDIARKILGGKGKKLHTHEIHLKRLEKGKILATHQLGDKHGNPPTDGQRSQAEYALNDPAELAAHVQQHMGPIPQQDDEQEPPE